MIKKILIIDDSRNIQEAVGFILQRRGYEIATAANGAEGMEKVRAFQPDLVVCDIMMPVMDGLTFVKTLRQDPATERLAVLMVTAKKSDEDILRGYNTGCDHYLTKPFTGKELLTGIEFLEKAIEEEKEGKKE